MPTPVTNERGMALGMALIAIVLIGLMIAGTFFLSTQAYRMQASEPLQQQAFSAAEYGVNLTLQKWNPDTAAAMAVGGIRTRTDTVTPGVTVVSRVTRLAAGVFWIASEGRVGSGIGTTARRRVGQVVILPSPSLPVPAAVMTRQTAANKLTLSGSASASGGDSTPAGWSCPPGGAPVAGYAMPDTTNISSSSSVPPTGSPAKEQTAAAADSNNYFNFGGGLTFDSLTKLANITYAASSNASSIQPSTLAGACNTADTKNWGEPWRSPTVGVVAVCQTNLPVIWAKGNFQFSSGRGQGILLVSGDFTASGGTEFDGLIIVRGSLTTSGGGIKANGAVLAYNQNNAKGTMSGSTMIRYSSCAIAAALGTLSGKTPARPVKYHGWTDLP